MTIYRFFRQRKFMLICCISVCCLLLTFNVSLNELPVSDRFRSIHSAKSPRLNYFGLPFENYVAKGRREPKAAQSEDSSKDKYMEFHQHFRGEKSENEILENIGNYIGSDKTNDVEKVQNQNEEINRLTVGEPGQSIDGVRIVRDGIYWSIDTEKLVPKGLSQTEAIRYIHQVQRQTVQYLLPPTWTRCGRPKNAFIVMHDGKSMCVRYRDPHIKLVLGEVMSYHLSRFLGMDNVPIVVLSRVASSAPQWRHQAVNMSAMNWKSNKMVALIQWIPNLEAYNSFAKIPKLLLEAYKSNQSVTAKTLSSASLLPWEIIDLIQWGTMIIFDYLTGNYDRVASMQDGAYEQNNPKVLQDNIRNLRKSRQSKLWLIDNESGLLDAYELLYNDLLGGYRFRRFHREMLQTMCVFQRPVVESIKNLHQAKDPYDKLNKFSFSHDPLLRIAWQDNMFNLYEKKFKERLNDIYEWIKHCEMLSKR